MASENRLGSMARTIALGDIHGCSAALAAVIEAVNPQPDDTIIALGDYIDRGPDSHGVVEQLLALSERCQLIPLLGNHESLLLAVRHADEQEEAFDFWVRGCGGDATLDSYGGRLDRIPPAHWNFFASLRRFHETDTHLFVHANYRPHVALADQPDEVLLWSHLIKTPLPHISGKTAIVGHTPQPTGQILDAGHLVCIDTWCFGQGYLTAYDVHSREIWQADKKGRLREHAAARSPR